MLIRLLWVGRTRWEPAAVWIDDLRRRTARFCPVEIIEIKDAPGTGRSRQARESKDLLAKLTGRGVVAALDVTGERMSSIEFSKFLENALATRRELTFVLGGPEGLGPEVMKGVDRRVSFSPLTMTHEMIRVVLMEQIYRAFGILKGTPYHR